MPSQEMIQIRNKRTGQVISVPRDKFINRPRASEDEEPAETQGFEGVLNDITQSLGSVPEAGMEMLKSIPGGFNKVARYATSNNPLETLGNIGAGGVESGAALLSAPQTLVKYLAKKFPGFQKRLEETGQGNALTDPTIYEGLMKFEKEHNLGAQSPEEESVRGAGGLLFGGRALQSLPSMLARSSALASEQAGRGGDPIHAAILGVTGDLIAKNSGKIASKAAEIPKAAVEAVQNIPETAGKVAGGTLGLAGGVGHLLHIPGSKAVGEIGSYIQHATESPEKAAQKKLFGDITPADLPKIQERVDAAKRLGLTYLTPAEATLHPWEAAKQGNVGRTSEGSKLMYGKGKQRAQSEESAINNLFDTIYDEKTLDPQKQAAYEQTMKSNVPEDFMEKFKDDPVIENAIEVMHNDPVYRKALGITKKSKDNPIVPQNTFEYWDQVKRVLGDMEESHKSGEGRKPFKKSVIAKARREMVADMDAIQPTYETARNISEREFTRKKLEDIFDKKLMTGNNFAGFLRSKSKFDDVMHKLKAFPEAQQKLKDMKLLFGELIPGDPSIRTAAQMERTGMWNARNKLDAFKRELDEKYGKEHDVAAVNLMTDPEWMSKLAEYLKKK